MDHKAFVKVMQIKVWLYIFSMTFHPTLLNKVKYFIIRFHNNLYLKTVIIQVDKYLTTYTTGQPSVNVYLFYLGDFEWHLADLLWTVQT